VFFRSRKKVCSAGLSLIPWNLRFKSYLKSVGNVVRLAMFYHALANGLSGFTGRKMEDVTHWSINMLLYAAGCWGGLLGWIVLLANGNTVKLSPGLTPHPKSSNHTGFAWVALVTIFRNSFGYVLGGWAT
jgi:hypothetical protein